MYSQQVVDILHVVAQKGSQQVAVGYIPKLVPDAVEHTLEVHLETYIRAYWLSWISHLELSVEGRLSMVQLEEVLDMHEADIPCQLNHTVERIELQVNAHLEQDADSHPFVFVADACWLLMTVHWPVQLT